MRSFFTLERVFRTIALVGVAAALVWLVWLFGDLVLFLFIGFVLAYVLGPVVDWFQQFGMSRTPAVLVTFLLVLGLFGFLLAFMIPFIGQQSTGLANLVSRENLVRVARSIEQGLAAYVPMPEQTLQEGFVRAFEALFEQERITDTVTYMVGLFTNILYALIIVPFTMFFFMKDGRNFREYGLDFVPNRYLEITLDLIEKVERNIGAYFRAILLRALVVSIVASVLLSFIGLRYAVLVGIFTGIANTIPYFGPIIGFVAGAIVGIAQTGDLSMVFSILLVMAFVQLVDNAVLQPLYFSRAANAHPLVILCVVLIGARLAGIFGMLIAIPVLTIARVTTKQILWSLRNYHIFRAS